MLDPAVFQRVLDVKVRGTFLCTQAIIKRLYAQGDGGKIDAFLGAVPGEQILEVVRSGVVGIARGESALKV